MVYIFGIYIAENIGYSDLTGFLDSSNEKEEFLQFWSCICLCHDMGYFLEKENMDKEDRKKIDTLEGFMEKNGILYDCRNCMDRNLLEGYYKYRLKENDIIDHGIAGAYFIYDMMMKSCEKEEKLENEVTYYCKPKKFCAEETRKRAEKYATIIARHNMWFADLRNKKVYEKYGLHELIQDKTEDKRYSWQKD